MAFKKSLRQVGYRQPPRETRFVRNSPATARAAQGPAQHGESPIGPRAVTAGAQAADRSGAVGRGSGANVPQENNQTNAADQEVMRALLKRHNSSKEIG